MLFSWEIGLKPTDWDSHSPAFFIVRKSLHMEHKDLHLRSEAGKRKDKEKSHRKKKAKRHRREEAYPQSTRPLLEPKEEELSEHEVVV